MLTSCDASSLVIDSLCNQAERQNATIACFYFDFAAQKEQSPTRMLGALVKQLVWGLEETPEEVSRAYQDQKNSIGGRAPQLSDIVKMLQSTSSKKPTFICIDALDECATAVDKDQNRHQPQTSILGFRISETHNNKKKRQVLEIILIV